jgi:pilus assembly protein CpaD
MRHMIRQSIRTCLIAAPLLALAACASTGGSRDAEVAAPRLATEQYPLRVENETQSISLRINPQGLSENQRRALDKVAQDASWTQGDPVDVTIITAGDPGAVAAGRTVSAYLSARDVLEDTIAQESRPDQPADIVTVSLTYAQSVINTCNQSWENLSRTATNRPYANFGCAVNSNLAAQIADPRDIASPARPTSPDALRKSEILAKYRKGEVTSAASDEQARGTVSDAVQ